MNERISRIVAGMEAVVFMLPPTGVMLFLIPFAGMIAIGRVLAAFALFGNGSMAVIPLAHLLLERLLRANRPMEPTR